MEALLQVFIKAFFSCSCAFIICIGDEIVTVNGTSIKGQTKVQVAKLIQACGVRQYLL